MAGPLDIGTIPEQKLAPGPQSGVQRDRFGGRSPANARQVRKFDDDVVATPESAPTDELACYDLPDGTDRALWLVEKPANVTSYSLAFGFWATDHIASKGGTGIDGFVVTDTVAGITADRYAFVQKAYGAKVWCYVTLAAGAVSGSPDHFTMALIPHNLG